VAQVGGASGSLIGLIGMALGVLEVPVALTGLYGGCVMALKTAPALTHLGAIEVGRSVFCKRPAVAAVAAP
jgi:hypothetical protein